MSGFRLGQEYGFGRTFQRTVTPGVQGAAAAPPAGASYTYTCTPWDFMRLVFCTFTFTSDNNAANRYITLEYPGGDSISVLADGAPVVVTANTTAQRFVGALRRGASEWNTNTDVFFPLSGIWLEAGRTIALNVANVQVGDQLSKIRLTFDTVTVKDDGTERVHEIEEITRFETAQPPPLP